MKAYQRLLEYVKFPTASDPATPEEQIPSTQVQWELARYLKAEMEQLGLSDVTLDGHCYLFGRLPGNIPDYTGPTLGFIAHMDVSYEAPCQNVQPRVLHYLGGDITVDQETGLEIRLADFPELAQNVGDELLLTDGRTLLGADDKAGIAEIMTMAETLLACPDIKHGPIVLGFTPDEEIGRGADMFDVARFGADYAYTVDGARFGEINYETFNAVKAKVHLTGKSIHPGEAKDRLVNASLLAMEFNALLPEWERPENTERYQGFYHLLSIKSEVEQADLEYILRDHDVDILEQRMLKMKAAEAVLNHKYGEGTARVVLEEQYRNMAQIVLQHKHLLDAAVEAVRELGGVPNIVPARGGTDGCQLSFKGLPCPNLGTGSFNHHGRLECASIQEMDLVAQELVLIAQKMAVSGK